MYFLNGNRLYIKPARNNETLQEQLNDCLEQIQQINEGKQVFKLNFFIDSNSDSNYLEIKTQIQNRVNALFSNRVMQTIIAQPPLNAKIILEVFYYDPLVWKMQFVEENENTAVLFKNNDTRFLIGSVQETKAANCKTNAENAFSAIDSILQETRFNTSDIIRQWNYIEAILGFDTNQQRYQEFNDVRTTFYKDAFSKKGYPAATGIGMKNGGVIIEFIAVKSSKAITCPVDNPEQISAHHYSNEVLIGARDKPKTTPKFERARYFQYENKKMIFISGTASIHGEKTVGIDNAAKQTEITINNIKQLYSGKAFRQLPAPKMRAQYGHARVYVKKLDDFNAIKTVFEKHYGKLPVVFIIADICRDDLLVEIEGKVILKEIR